MSCFGDLFRLFPDKVMDLAVDECIEAQRLASITDEAGDFDIQCEFCTRQALYSKSHYSDEKGLFERPLPGFCRDRTCGVLECAALVDYYWDKSKGSSRRRGFMAWNGDKFFDVGTEERKTLCVAYMLKREAASCQMTK